MSKRILIRVPYGKADTVKEYRDYRENNRGPTGTIEEFKQAYQNDYFEIIDTITNDKEVCKSCGKVMELEDLGDDDCRKLCYVCVPCCNQVRNY